ncbi:DeoR family transcriptional regulator [Orbus hercynius]|uniref:DeoR family transcriptional regulator n=1 Tax=Orbus hercynius TaxID=593135 RepID=A0A495RF10_9GAMM|nr:DeoR/GlpR family DNA-binding transcription regulator [Orbus hercynius]RKS86077.1 DeoR family transcriptional regulator [Orbus hercynius]
MARASSALLKRRLDIAEIVRKQGEVKVDELSELLNVSGVTIRQDLTYLEQQGYLKRSFGGAIYLAPEGSASTDHRSTERYQQPIDHQSDIELVQQSLNYIQDGDTLFLGHGQLIRKLIPFLYGKKGIKLIINDLANALLAKEFTQAEVIIVGGMLADNNLIQDDNVLRFIISQYPISRFIIEVAAMSRDNALIIENSEQLKSYQQVLKHAQQTIAILPQRLVNDAHNSVGKLKDVEIAILSRAAVAHYHQQLFDCYFTQSYATKHSITYQNKQEA